uniref:Uncharacterized protein n=1 Tax=Anguilla anguilla TaxID=7936 RepID=A0A0E9SFD1_ANGAN
MLCKRPDSAENTFHLTVFFFLK